MIETGLPDYSRYNVPKQEKIYQMNEKIPKGHKIYVPNDRKIFKMA
jgi:hypothetical protein